MERSLPQLSDFVDPRLFKFGVLILDIIMEGTCLRLFIEALVRRFFFQMSIVKPVA